MSKITGKVILGHYVFSYENMRKLVWQVRELRADLSRRDDLIKRLVEDGDRLAQAETGMLVDCDEEYIYCLHSNACGGHTYQKGVDFVHSPDCPITLHRALMKEMGG